MLSWKPPTFAAIDFETANRYRNSACAVGVVRVERGLIVRRAFHLIRPPFRYFEFTSLHGLDWLSVRRARSFGEVWTAIRPFFRGVDFIAAHNAPFDRSVMRACCRWYGISEPNADFECTVRLARRVWRLRPTTLRDVAAFLGLRLRHHHAGSDAEVCARIVLSATAA